MHACMCVCVRVCVRMHAKWFVKKTQLQAIYSALYTACICILVCCTKLTKNKHTHRDTQQIYYNAKFCYRKYSYSTYRSIFLQTCGSPFSINCWWDAHAKNQREEEWGKVHACMHTWHCMAWQLRKLTACFWLTIWLYI